MAKRRIPKKTWDEMDIEVVDDVETELYTKVRGYIAKARTKVYAVANKEMVDACWNVGREIVEKQGGASLTKYGDESGMNGIACI